MVDALVAVSDSLLPPGVGPAAALILLLASFFTSALTAAAGIGGGVALLALMTYLVPLAAVVPVHGAVQLGSNAGRTFLLRSHIVWACLIAFLLGGIPGALVGRYAVGLLPDSLMRLLLGLFILALTWLPMPLMAGISARGFALTGFVTTGLTMVFGATGPLNAVVLSKAFGNRMQLLANMATVMTAQHFLKIAVFGAAGFAFTPWVPLIVAMMITGFAGTWVGRHLLLNMPETRFRLLFKLCLSALSLDLVRRGLPAL